MYIIKQNTLPKFWYQGFLIRRSFLLLLTPLSFLILWISKKYSWISEYIFARKIYSFSSQVISRITGILPISLTELSLLVLPVLLIAYILWFIVKIRKSKRKKRREIGYLVTKQVTNLFCVASLLFFFFTILAGTNYYRYSFTKSSGLEIKESSVQELYEVLEVLSKEAAAIRLQLQEEGTMDETGVIQYSKEELKELGLEVQRSFKNMKKEYPVFDGTYGPFKPVKFSRFMSRMEITGIYWPYTVEANINVDASDYSIPATMAHEMAHQRGFMREDEANFIAYLVCSNSDNLKVRYSGIMLALIYGNNQLYQYNEELYYKITSNYNDSMRLDVREEYYYWKQFEDTVISTVSNSMNDTYLKVNNQSDGVKSYGRMVDLLLAYYREK